MFDFVVASSVANVNAAGVCGVHNDSQLVCYWNWPCSTTCQIILMAQPVVTVQDRDDAASMPMMR